MNENVKKMIELKNDEAFGKKVKEALSQKGQLMHATGYTDWLNGEEDSDDEG